MCHPYCGEYLHQGFSKWSNKRVVYVWKHWKNYIIAAHIIMSRVESVRENTAEKGDNRIYYEANKVCYCCCFNSRYDYDALLPLNNSQPLEMKNRLLNTHMKNDIHRTWLHFNMVFIISNAPFPRIYPRWLWIPGIWCQESFFLFGFTMIVPQPKVLQVENLCKRLWDIEFMKECIFLSFFHSLRFSICATISANEMYLQEFEEKEKTRNVLISGHGKWCDKRRVILNRMACVGAWHRIQNRAFRMIIYLRKKTRLRCTQTHIDYSLQPWHCWCFFLFGLNLDLFL